MKLVTADLPPLLEAVADLVGNGDGVGGAPDVGHEKNELVAARPAKRVGAAEEFRQPLRDGQQQKVADGTAQTVIDALEAIEID